MLGILVCEWVSSYYAYDCVCVSSYFSSMRILQQDTNLIASVCTTVSVSS
jgi:hypothetical protein